MDEAAKTKIDYEEIRKLACHSILSGDEDQKNMIDNTLRTIITNNLNMNDSKRLSASIEKSDFKLMFFAFKIKINQVSLPIEVINIIPALSTLFENLNIQIEKSPSEKSILDKFKTAITARLCILYQNNPDHFKDNLIKEIDQNKNGMLSISAINQLLKSILTTEKRHNEQHVESILASEKFNDEIDLKPLLEPEKPLHEHSFEFSAIFDEEVLTQRICECFAQFRDSISENNNPIELGL